ncbi:glycoprotein D [Macropodid alphaherpesvirus 1]|uniref:Glycoprotein D n=1 Tax=Macropodid alphaherpesvirus 1 TaxID=137443 RepID=Q8JND0_9ALPH|nr:glycoprotein D [Macropodid alphaherpesvirus 1]AAL13138.1 glycoprotein D [Macropodid alphaherpesvirus 1]AMB17031.1 glycoprotein D [Macropodid alphaherpesvirus 1]
MPSLYSVVIVLFGIPLLTVWGYEAADPSLIMVSPEKFRGTHLANIPQRTDPPGVKRVYHIQETIADPFQTPSTPVSVFYAVLDRPCGSVLLSGPTEAAQILRGATDEDHNKTYNLTIAWYRSSGECAIPLVVMEYTECSYNQSMGFCPIRTMPRWQYYDSFSATSEDNLGFLMHAPPYEATGTYTRLIQINDWVEITQFVFEQRTREACRQSIPLFVPPAACRTAEEYKKGITVDAVGMLPRYIPENQRTVAVYSLMLVGWTGPKPPATSSLLPPELYATNRSTPDVFVAQDYDEEDEDDPEHEVPALAATVVPKVPPNWHAPKIYEFPHTNPNPDSKTPWGTIAGGVGAGIIVLLALVAVAYIVRRRAKRRRGRRVGLPHIRDIGNDVENPLLA